MSPVPVRRAAFLLGPLAGLCTWWLMANAGWSVPGAATGGLTVWCGIWWIFEPIAIPATSLIPLGVFPLVGALDSKQVALSYGDPLILLLIGGAMLSKAMEKSGAHRRIALGMVHLVGGGKPRNLVFGFVVASAFLSMWVSNTATTLMLLPVAAAVLEGSDDRELPVPLFLGIAYAASIGGLGTPIGTPPNVIFLKIYGQTVGQTPTFLDWMLWALPAVICMIPIMALWITRNLRGEERLRVPALGSWRAEERRVLIVFAGTALAWMTIKEPFGGWTGWLGLANANYASVAFVAVILLFVLPDGRGGRLLDWETASGIHWGVMVLFAAGIAIAKAFEANGISAAIGESLSVVSRLSIFVLIISVCLCVTFLTEVTSNTATTTLLLPILAATALGSGINPALLMLPATLSASFAFMLPVATAPNAIVYGTGKISIERMAREGVVLNLLGAVVISVLVYLMIG